MRREQAGQGADGQAPLAARAKTEAAAVAAHARQLAQTGWHGGGSSSWLRSSNSCSTLVGVCAPVPGVRAYVKLSRKPLGQGDGLEPERVRRPELGLTWLVAEVLDAWEHPEYAVSTYWLEEPVVTARYVLTVCGPLPGNPGERGTFVMVVRAFGDRPEWWVTVGDEQGAELGA